MYKLREVVCIGSCSAVLMAQLVASSIAFARQGEGPQSSIVIIPTYYYDRLGFKVPHTNTVAPALISPTPTSTPTPTPTPTQRLPATPKSPSKQQRTPQPVL